MIRQHFMMLCAGLSGVILVGCGSTVSTRLYSVSSKVGVVEYSKPSSCYGPSYSYSVKIHPNVFLVVEEGHYGRGVFSVNVDVAKDTEVFFDESIRIIDDASGASLDFPPYTLRMYAGESPEISYSNGLFGPGREPPSIQKDRIYDGGGNYQYHAKLQMSEPHRPELSMRVPLARIDDTQHDPIMIDFKEITVTWRKSCYDFR